MSHFDPSRLEKVRRVLKDERLDAWIMSITDPYLSEYVAPHWQSVHWLTGFSGSAAVVCITPTEAALFTDSRYWIQAEKELQGTPFEVVRSGSPQAPTPMEWLKSKKTAIDRIGYAKHLWSLDQIDQFRLSLGSEQRLLAHDDVIDLAWTVDRPCQPINPIEPLSLPLIQVPTKLANLRNALKSDRLSAMCVTALDEIAWLIDCRGNDIPYNPVFLARMIVTLSEARLYTEVERLSPQLVGALENVGVTLHSPQIFVDDLKVLAKEHKFLLDWKHQTMAIKEYLGDNFGRRESPILNLKRLKSSEEYEGIQKAMLSDGVALVEFYAELDERLANHETLTELDLVKMIDRQRAKGHDCCGNSFGTIVAFGPNAALPHYSPKEESNATLTNGLLLIDSGGQYLTGTTDITRMTGIGQVSEAMKNDVTHVLKSMIALAACKVPVGTSGAQLDAIARQPLWALGLDFGHGTGHGVGYRLNVHEGPFHISPRAIASGENGLQAGQLVSDEPGIYRPGQWGVRIENLIFAKRSTDKTPFGEFLGFEVMTLCPIDTRILNTEHMTARELAWLNDYHADVYTKLSQCALSPRAHHWLTERTKRI